MWIKKFTTIRVGSIFFLLAYLIYASSLFASEKFDRPWEFVNCVSIDTPYPIEANVAINFIKLREIANKGSNISVKDVSHCIKFWIKIKKEIISFDELGLNFKDDMQLYRGDHAGYVFALMFKTSDMHHAMSEFNDSFFNGWLILGKLNSTNDFIAENSRKSKVICTIHFSKNPFFID